MILFISFMALSTVSNDIHYLFIICHFLYNMSAMSIEIMMYAWYTAGAQKIKKSPNTGLPYFFSKRQMIVQRGTDELAVRQAHF